MERRILQTLPTTGGLPRRLVVLGPPGAGKGTQAAILAEAMGARHISTGDLVRAAIAADTEIGRTVRGYNDRGELVPDQIIVDLVTPYLSAAPRWILDGFPRDLPQARVLDAVLNSMGTPVDQVIALQVPDAVLVERLQDRRVSAATGRTYNLRSEPPPPDDPGPFIQRTDDHPDEILRRLQIYHRLTEPLLAYYAQCGVLHTVEACSTVEDVQQRIRSALAA